MGLIKSQKLWPVSCSLFTTTTNNSLQHQAAWGQHSYAYSSSNPIYSKPLSLHLPRKFWQGQPAFHFSLEGWLRRTIFGNMSSFIGKTWPSHLNLSVTIALESGIEPHFCTTCCLKYGQSAGYPEQSIGNFSGKHLVNVHLLFRHSMLLYWSALLRQKEWR